MDNLSRGARFLIASLSIGLAGACGGDDSSPTEVIDPTPVTTATVQATPAERFTPGRVNLVAGGTVTFAFGSSELGPDTQKALVMLAGRLRKTPAEILVEGHADGVGDGGAEGVRELGVLLLDDGGGALFGFVEQVLELGRFAGAGFEGLVVVAEHGAEPGVF